MPPPRFPALWTRLFRIVCSLACLLPMAPAPAARADSTAAASVTGSSNSQPRQMSTDANNESKIAWLPDLLYTGKRFVMGTFEEEHGFDWVVPPDEPVEKAKKDEKDRPPEAPSLRRRTDPPR